MERTQFTFYASFASALRRIKRKETRCAAYDAIVCYALYNQEPDLDALPDAAAMAFELIRPTLDSSRRKAENGKSGRRGKQNGSKTEAKPKQNDNENENEIEIEVENELEVEDECPIPPISPSQEGEQAALSRVYGRYMDCMPPPSQTTSELLRDYTRRLGADVVIHAIDTAVDERKLAWSYIHGILKRYTAEGLDSMAKVQYAEAEWRERKNKSARGRGGELLDMIERGEFGD